MDDLDGRYCREHLSSFSFFGHSRSVVNIDHTNGHELAKLDEEFHILKEKMLSIHTDDFSQTYRHCKILGYLLLFALWVLSIYGIYQDILKYVQDRLNAELYLDESPSRLDGYIHHGFDCVASALTCTVYYFSTTEYGKYHVRFILSVIRDDGIPKWILVSLMRAAGVFVVIRTLFLLFLHM